MRAGERLTTARLWLIPLTRRMVRRRLRQGSFRQLCRTPAGLRVVRFEPEWAAEFLPLFALWQEARLPPRAMWLLLARDTAEAIGIAGIRGLSGATAELGYAVNPAWRGRGYATEAVVALVALLRPRYTVTAETTDGNTASERVLRNAGFGPDGALVDGCRRWRHPG